MGDSELVSGPAEYVSTVSPLPSIFLSASLESQQSSTREFPWSSPWHAHTFITIYRLVSPQLASPTNPELEGGGAGGDL